ncbi:MAG: glucuronate isomerase [Anaerolineaceae bacterium]|nr:glucuronate isomerase [Anaerolineaceae bacterium]
MPPLYLPEDRYLDPANRDVALRLYHQVRDLPLICPHGHVDPLLFADPDYRFGSPSELFITPDHYVFRMLRSQGIALEELGIPRVDGGPVESDPRVIWQRFADHYHLFRGTPTGGWLDYSFHFVFGVEEKLTGASAQAIYDQIAACLGRPEFRPRALYEQFNVEVLTTTDAATDPLLQHEAIRRSGWSGRILPTFRPDTVVNLDTPGWRGHVGHLAEQSGIDITSYDRYLQALEQRRGFFGQMGATATDHAALTAYTEPLGQREAESLFQSALRGEASAGDARRFTGHMLIEMARMSVEDGLVMQLHVGSLRNHDPALQAGFGTDKGADIPVASEWTRNLRPLLTSFGSHPRFSLILFTLDESGYGREMAPLAGYYPAVKLGPPWWFFDSVNGMARYFDLVMETAGIYNTVGFNDDTRAFTSIPARHDVWRRTAVNWIAGLHKRGFIDMQDAEDMAQEMAVGLARRAYRFAT